MEKIYESFWRHLKGERKGKKHQITRGGRGQEIPKLAALKA